MRGRRIAQAAALGVSALALIGPSAHAEGRCGDPAARPWCDTSLSPERRADLLAAQLTDEELRGEGKDEE